MNAAVTALDKQISDYLTQLSTKQKKAVLTVVKTFAEEIEPVAALWDNPTFVAEMDKRVSELESGKVKGFAWEEVKSKARKTLGRKRR